MSAHAAETILASGAVLTLAGIGAAFVGFVVFALARELACRAAEADVRDIIGGLLALGGIAADRARGIR